MYSGLARHPNVNSISMLDHSNLLQIANLSITYDRFNKVYRIVGTDTYDSTLTAMGYRVDSGPLQPLYFQGKIYDMAVPTTAKTLEVCTQPSVYTGWQYLKLDIPASTLTMERTYPFSVK